MLSENMRVDLLRQKLEQQLIEIMRKCEVFMRFNLRPKLNLFKK